MSITKVRIMSTMCSKKTPPHKVCFFLNMSLALGTFSFFYEARKTPNPTLNWYQIRVGLGAFLASKRKRKGGRVQL